HLPLQRLGEPADELLAVRPRHEHGGGDGGRRQDEKGAGPEEAQPRLQPVEEPVRVEGALTPVQDVRPLERAGRAPGGNDRGGGGSGRPGAGAAGGLGWGIAPAGAGGAGDAAATAPAGATASVTGSTAVSGSVSDASGCSRP